MPVNNQRCGWLMAFLLLLVLPGAPAAQPAGDENAAILYWKAVALLTRPATAENMRLMELVQVETKALPPQAFAAMPDAARLLLAEQPALAALARAGQRERCDFEVEVEDSPNLNLDHLPLLNRLAHQALEAAKAYEYAGNPEGTAAIYVSLLRLARHLDQDAHLNSALFAANLVENVLDGLVGFLSREQEARAATILTTYFGSIDPPLLHLSSYLEQSATRHADWLLEDPDRSMRRLELLFGSAEAAAPTLDRLRTLPPKAQYARIEGWVQDYRERMAALAETTTKPYQLGVYELRDADEAKEAMGEAASDEAFNPLVPLLQPSLEKAFERALLAEAQMTMADILAAAALYRADLKKWPKNLEETGAFVGRTFSRDPFTGQEVQYKLKRRAPIVGVRAPKWLVQERDALYRADLAARRAQDDEAAEKFLDDVKRASRREKIRQRMETMETEP